jgi:hypothetical protein
MTGMPDILALIDSRLFALEIKTAGGRLKGSQLAELQRMQRAGAIAAVLCGPDSLRSLLADWRAGLLRYHHPWSIPCY